MPSVRRFDTVPGIIAESSPPVTGGPSMELNPDEMQAVVKRLKRAQGQIGGIVKMIEDGRECQDIVTQMAAVSKALDRAGLRGSLLEEILPEVSKKYNLTTDPEGRCIGGSSSGGISRRKRDMPFMVSRPCRRRLSA